MKDDDTILIHDDSRPLPLSAYSTHYQVATYCKNCEKHGAVWVKKKTRRFGLSITCTNCGCQVDL